MADTPFGASFGDPRKYIGSSGIGQAIKTGLTAYGMKQSGLTDWLDSLKNKTQSPNIPGSIAPNTAIADQGQLPAVPQAPENMNWGTMMPQAAVPPAAPGMENAAVPGSAPAVPGAPAMGPVPQQQDPQKMGLDWLNSKISMLGNLPTFG